MSMGVHSHIKWSELELRGVLEDEDARVHFQRCTQHFALHPYQMNDLNKALRQILSSKVNFYDEQLQGLVLAYKNPKLIDSLGAILHDSPFIHIYVEADFYIFKPEIGCTLKGIANKKADNHLGLLVHKAFNVSIPKADDCEEWLGDYVFVGQEVKFKVTHLDFKGKLPFIRGELEPDVTMGQIYYDRINSEQNEQIEEKPRNLSLDEPDDLASRRKKKPKEKIVIDFKNEPSDSEASDKDHKGKSQSNSREVPKSLNGKSRSLESKDSSNESDKARSSPQKSKNNEVRKKLKSPKISRTQNSSESETEVRTKVEGAEKELAPRMENNPIITDAIVSGKNKGNNSEVVQKSPSKHDKQNRSDQNGGNVRSDEEVQSPSKSHKKKQTLDSADGRSSDIDVKPALSVKRKILNDEEPAEVQQTKKSKKNSKVREDVVENIKKESIREKVDTDVKPAVSAERIILNDDEPEKVEETKKSKKKSKTREDVMENIKKEEDGIKDAPSVERKSLNEEETEKVEETKKTKKKSKVREDVTENIKIEGEGGTREEVNSEEEKQKRKAKKKKIKEEGHKEKEHVPENEQSEDDFVFVKPDLDAFEISPKKLKRKRRKTITEAEESPIVDSTDDQQEENTVDFFRDVRVKIEPDPSDVEDFQPIKKEHKRKRKHSVREEEIEGKKRRETFENVKIKQEPDMSDIEDSKKNKKKKKSREDIRYQNITIKTEPDASDVESTRPIKSERRESSKCRLESPKKET